MIRTTHLTILPLLGLLLTGCAGGGPPSEAGASRGVVPDLRGREVMVLPVQMRGGIPTDLTVDKEISFALSARGGEVGWAFPERLDALLRNSPGVVVDLRGLAVGAFLAAEVNRIGDPLYGDLRRIGTLAGADVALIPVRMTYDPQGGYSLFAALVTPVTGRVLWSGTVQGRVGAADAPGTLASVADALARTLLPLGR